MAETWRVAVLQHCCVLPSSFALENFYIFISCIVSFFHAALAYITAPPLAAGCVIK
jgi:hypothetical protein